MDRRNTSNELVNSNAFEYSFPICDDGDESGGDSNKSTPYYTPLEFFQSSFEFPSPKPVDKSVTSLSQKKQESYLDSTVGSNQENMDAPRSARQVAQSGVKQSPSATSPAVSRKLRRFSLYERRSCSPQHLLTKNAAGSVDLVATELPSPVDDKENAKPPQFFDQAREEMVQVITRSGNNSPIILKDECGSPKVSNTDGLSRHNFSPKLLASINNLKLANSPFGVISSAGYKNGNYFKFPEIDNVVQENTAGIETALESKQYNATNIPGKHRFVSSSLDCSQAVVDNTTETESACSRENMLKLNTSGRAFISNKNESGRKSRKNKNNLTIQITDTPVAGETALNPSVHSPSPSSAAKPKTPTIKSTKEKALSLDSAACETSLSIVIQSGESQTHVSCDEIDSKLHFSSSNSASSNQLRQRSVGSRDRLRPSISASSSKPSVCSSTSSPAVYRTPHKPNPLLHSSNTNLKTLPEFLTLVEFSTSSPKDREMCPFKQKSMDLPSSSGTSTTPNIRPKSSVSSSGSLLQRRGSNHSLTLNLHGSCGNLLGSCRGLSVSNYSLGSTANSTTNLNIKSASNPDPSRLLNSRQASESGGSTLQPNLHVTSQGAKQSLFRRRGSNQSLTLKNAATSCGNLNSFASQNSLNVHIPGVTRTTSFITPTHNTTSNASTSKRGLLERRGSNQSLTLNMSSSFGGIGAERNAFLCDETIQRRTDKLEPARGLLPQYCAQHHRKFFSSENLNKSNTQPAETSQTDRHNACRPFGSASDLKASGCSSVDTPTRNARGQTGLSVNIEESNICTCTGTRNIMTRPLSPQRKAEEFKTYLANIQTLQNASNVLTQHDLIKLNYIFDNSYSSSDKSMPEVLPIVLGVEPSSASSAKDTETPSSTTGGSLVTTSEDFEVVARYEEAVKDVLDSLHIDVEEQRRTFCDLHKEFWDLPLNHQEKPLVFGSQAKNRYKTILPNETTRVMLQNESVQSKNLDIYAKCSGPAEAEEIGADEKISSNIFGNKLLIASAETPYINANYIKGPDATTYSYVATQGPLPNTMFEFWLMVFQNILKQSSVKVENLFPKLSAPGTQYYQKLVMLTNFQEHLRQKCAIYFPVELNEVFIATSKEEVVPNNDVLVSFFDNYLKTSGDHAIGSENAIESFEVEEVDEEISKSLPQTGNCFVIKNVGIVRKSGYSIRQMMVLYCLIRPPVKSKQTSGSAAMSNECNKLPRLFIQRFCCYHYWYPDWPDHRSPRDINTLLDICLHILNLGKCEAEFESCGLVPGSHIAAQAIDFYQQDFFNILQPLPIIHCSAGVGRTGCLTAILNGIRQMRQALAYSLTSMAADLSNEKNTKPGQPLTPIDFNLPHEFYSDYNHSDVNLECNNDTDSSFTRNTLLYIDYIVEKYKAKQDVDDAPNAHATETGLSRKIPKLKNLPRMPDIGVDILGIVCNLRLSRGGMVQNSEQYELIHRALCLYLKRTLALKRF